MCQDCGCSAGSSRKIVEVQESVLASNTSRARANGEILEQHGILGMNLMSSPGSGKTLLLEKTIARLRDRLSVGVIEGDLETERDAERIRSTGVPVHQIVTGQTCHLDAFMLHDALHRFPLDALDLLFVENVGNLVCPATYELGTHLNVVLLSTTEGDDKPAKYPIAFKNADLMILSKMDLLPQTDFDAARAIRDARIIRPTLEVIRLSARSGEGLSEWLDYIDGAVQRLRG
jgi:hydrogenase nickel incorporation protein HypB